MRGLIKHELRNIWGVTLGFIAVGFVLGMGFTNKFQEIYRGYIGGWELQGMTFTSQFQGSETVFLACVLVGIVLLTIFQFREHKNVATGNFLASLPYTHQQIYSIKLIMGILSYTIAFVVYSVFGGLNWIWNIEWLREVERLIIKPEYVQDVNSLGSVFLAMLFIYIVTTAFYLFLCLMQYIISNCLGSIVISGLVLIAIPYTVIALGWYITERIGSQMIVALLGALSVRPEYFMDIYVPHEVRVEDILGRGTYFSYISIDPLIGYKLFVLVSILICLGVGIHTLSKYYGLGKREVFIVTRGFENVFKIGVTLCSALIPVIFYSMFLYTRANTIFLEVAMAITGVVGYIIAHKIVQIGKQ